ncbi:hypothetical protein [Rhizobium phage RHph_X2_26]|nr:hypothetical protein [Rhizobium phage RHph_X2_26]
MLEKIDALAPGKSELFSASMETVRAVARHVRKMNYPLKRFRVSECGGLTRVKRYE